MSWTAPDDVTDAWIGLDAPTDDALIQSWIEKAEREIRWRVPGIDDRIAGDESDLLETVKDIVSAMVTRVFRNPEGFRSINATSSTGPFASTQSQTFGGDNPGLLALTDDELARLRGVRSSRAFTVSMIPTTSPYSGSL